MSGRKQLAAILHADIAGFSSLIHAAPDMVERIRRRHQDTFAKYYDNHDGLHLQHFGDHTIAIFNSAGAAVECAIAIQHDLMNHPEIPVRMGVHTGEIILDDMGIYGGGVKVASRIERIAQPGSILLSSKVQDDLKNHPWIQTTYLRNEHLPDLSAEISIYAVSNRGIYLPPSVPPERRTVRPYQAAMPEKFEPMVASHADGKSKRLAAFLAFFFGMLGVHRFYLGKKLQGILYMIFFVLSFIISFEEDAPIVFFSVIIPWIDAILFLAMPHSDFNDKYNQGRSPANKNKKSRGSLFRRSKNPTFGLLKRGLRKFESGQYEHAIRILDDLLDEEPTNHVGHYYLARCFSLLGDEKQALLHLDQAIEFGYDDFDHIDNDYALAHLRNTALYQAFKINNYQLPEYLPAAEEDLLNSRPNRGGTFDQLDELVTHLNEGTLSAEEFEREKSKLLS